MLTLSGTSSLANYQAALDSITYSFTGDGELGLGTARTITWVVNDGVANSNTATTTMTLSANAEGPEPPTLSLGGTTATVSEEGAVILPSITVTPFDSDDVLTLTIAGLPTGATITDSVDGTVFSGSSFTLTGSEVGSTLTLHDGTNNGTIQLVVTANNTTSGEATSSAPQDITVTINPAAAGTIAITTATKNTKSISGTFTDSVNVSSVTVTDDGHRITGGTVTINNTNHTWSLTGFPNSETLHGGDTLVATAIDTLSNVLTSSTFTVASPAGIAGSPINLALTDPSGVRVPTTVTVTGMPSDWTLNSGTNLGNGTWTVQTDDLSALTVLTAAAYAGAIVLGVTESWANPDGSTGTAFVSDTVEAYAPGSPIFAWSGVDTLTGAGGNDLFVFAQPIGNDTIYNFNVASDQIDLSGFAGIASFGDLAGHIAGDGNGDTVITLGVGETITLHGIDPASLAANDFVFDQTPNLDNAGIMTVSDGAMLPLSGTIDNTGTIALNSTGDETDLQIIGDGVTLEGGGNVVLSDNSENMIVGTNVDATLTNIDNTISGAGQIGIGDGNLTLVNETAGTIDANFADGVLTLDTGNIIVNAGLLEATNGGTLQIDDNVSNSSTLAANGGTLVAEGNVSGSGNVAIGGGGHADFAGILDQNVMFSGPGMLELDHAQSFGGTVSGFATGDAIDLNDLTYSANETLTWTQGAGSGVLTIADNGTTENITLDGNYSQSEFALTNDATSAGGTVVESAPSVDSTVAPGASDVAGTISVADLNASATPTASVTSDGANYFGSFALNQVSVNDGNAMVSWEFDFANDQITFAPGETVTQSYDVAVTDANNPAANTSQTVAVSIGGPGNDNFVFAPGVGADTVVNFNPQQDTVELNGFSNAQTVLELQALITTDAHGNAVIDLGHHDSVTLANTTAAQVQQAIQAGHVLLH